MSYEPNDTSARAGIEASGTFAKSEFSQIPNVPESFSNEGLKVLEYENPELATVVLMNGLISHALHYINRPVTDLEQLKELVTIPVTELPSDGLDCEPWDSLMVVPPSRVDRRADHVVLSFPT